MKHFTIMMVAGALGLSVLASTGVAQEVKIKNAKSWELTGRAQLQYLYNADIDGDAATTNNGFRIRRGRLQAKTKLTDWVTTKFQIEVRDNSPTLKDAEGKIKLGQNLFVRFGQFKTPVWREEMRSSGKLLLVERSEVAGFLDDLHLSSRHVGFELGGKYKSGISWAANISNGAGSGRREDAGRTKSDFVNNGKLVVGRVNLPVDEKFEVGVSAASNRAENAANDGSASLYTIAPDFGFYSKLGSGELQVEGGAAFGSVSKDITGDADDQSFTLFDVTGRWTKKMAEPNANFGGMDGFELAGGISYIEPDSDISGNETLVLRGGPAFYFGKNTRIQANGELELPSADGADSIFKVRLQTTFNF